MTVVLVRKAKKADKAAPKKLRITVQLLIDGERQKPQRGYVSVYVPTSKNKCDLTLKAELQNINIRNTYRQVRVIPGKSDNFGRVVI